MINDLSSCGLLEFAALTANYMRARCLVDTIRCIPFGVTLLAGRLMVHYILSCRCREIGTSAFHCCSTTTTQPITAMMLAELFPMYGPHMFSKCSCNHCERYCDAPRSPTIDFFGSLSPFNKTRNFSEFLYRTNTEIFLATCQLCIECSASHLRLSPMIYFSLLGAHDNGIWAECSPWKPHRFVCLDQMRNESLLFFRSSDSLPMNPDRFASGSIVYNFEYERMDGSYCCWFTSCMNTLAWCCLGSLTRQNARMASNIQKARPSRAAFTAFSSLPDFCVACGVACCRRQ